MEHATQVALMPRIFGLLDRHATELVAAPYVNQVAAYTAPAQLERERSEHRALIPILGLQHRRAAVYTWHAGVPLPNRRGAPAIGPQE